MDILKKFLNKSFAKLRHNCTVSNESIVPVIQTAAETQDFMENSSKKLGNEPNADTIFNRIRSSNEECLKMAFLFILEFMIKRIKAKFNHREWILAIDYHYEPFYGKHKDFWVHGYMPPTCKDCTGSYCYITIAVVINELKFTLLALPVHAGQAKDDLIEELVSVAQKHMKIRMILFDRGFHSGSVVRKLEEMKVKFIIFGQQNRKIKIWMKDLPRFSHKYFYDNIIWRENMTKQKERVKYLLIKDYIDLRKFVMFDWVFITNLSNIKAISYVHLYRKRWAIEDSYKQFKKFIIKTTSVNYFVRYFLFLICVILFNLWKFYNIIMECQITFKEFVFKLFLTGLSIDHLDTAKKDIALFLEKISLT